MAEYIDLDTPLELKAAWGNTYKPYTSTLRELLDINHIPYKVADVRPVVRGKWGVKNECSECGCQPWFERDIHTLNFCPNCGALME